ncbi:MAG: patatin-like phospholipase family protein, partial [Betaproteobacteria bacterium]|nr:patatin-like phospholipase family protein [Betaproteobacteria bacterium]
MARLIKPQPVSPDPHAGVAGARPRAKKAAPRIKRGLALAGGGPLGAMYEVGVLMALDESLIGLDLNDMDVYVGVSAGSVITAGLANGLKPADIFRLFIENKAANKSLGALKPEVFLRPAYREYWRRAKTVPPLFMRALWRYLTHPLRGSALESFAALSRALPTGLFDNDSVRKYLAAAFNESGRTDDFRKLKNKLFSIATDLDTGESVRFGGPGLDHIPISRAVQASAALPGLFPPVEIEGHYYVDGALKKTLNASVALEEGARLVLCVNPLVPFDANRAKRRGKQELEKLVEGGLPTVLSQTFRAIIHSRMHVGLQKYVTQYENADVVLFEPTSDDAEMFFTNLFSYATRRKVCEHAYQKTRKDLLNRRHELEPVLAKYGIRMDLAALKDESRTLDERLARRAKASPKQRLRHA